MSNGIEIKNLPSATTIKQNDTMTIVQDRENKQLTLDRFANESDLTTLTPLEARCDEVKAKIEVDEYSAEITTSQSMSKIGSDDSGVDLHENVLDGAFESCVLKGKTKYRDIDTGEILEDFEEGRNLELITVRMPILSTVGKNLFDKNTMKTSWWVNADGVRKDDGNTAYSIIVPITENKIYTVSLKNSNRANYAFLDKDYNTLLIKTGNNRTDASPIGSRYLLYYLNNTDLELCSDIQLEEGSTATPYEPYKTSILSLPEEVVLRSLPDGTCDTLNVEAGEYVQKIGERSYQNGDTNSNTLVTDGTKTHYKLSSPIITKVDVQGFPHAYKNGHTLATNKPSE